MAFTATDLDAIDQAIASGLLEATVDGDRVRYRDVAELKAARRIVVDAIATAAGQAPINVSYGTFSKG